MSTITRVLLNNAGSAATASTTASKDSAAAPSIPSSTSQTNYTPSVVNQLAGLTYTSAGLLHSSTPQTPSSAQAAYRAVQDAITQAQNDLMSSTTSTSSATDMFGASNSSSDPLQALNNAQTRAAATDSKAQTALKAYAAAQDAVTQAQAAMLKMQNA